MWNMNTIPSDLVQVLAVPQTSGSQSGTKPALSSRVSVLQVVEEESLHSSISVRSMQIHVESG